MRGHEHEPKLAQKIGDLQHACVFKLPTPIDCTAPGANCDCNNNSTTNNVLCQADDGSYSSDTQYRAKAYPSLRQLAVLKGVADQGIVGSICPAQLQQAGADYGYRAAIGAIIDRLKQRFKGPCLNRSITPDSNKQVACVVLEGRKLHADESCSCDATRSNDSPQFAAAVLQAKSSKEAVGLGLDCFCEIDQLANDELDACQNSLEPDPTTLQSKPADGWCYIDAQTFPLVGNKQLVDHCPSGKKHTIRFVGQGRPVDDSFVYITCHEGNE